MQTSNTNKAYHPLRLYVNDVTTYPTALHVDVHQHFPRCITSSLTRRLESLSIFSSVFQSEHADRTYISSCPALMNVCMYACMHACIPSKPLGPLILYLKPFIQLAQSCSHETQANDKSEGVDETAKTGRHAGWRLFLFFFLSFF